MESPENDSAVFRSFHKPWKSIKPIPTFPPPRRRRSIYERIPKRSRPCCPPQTDPSGSSFNWKRLVVPSLVVSYFAFWRTMHLAVVLGVLLAVGFTNFLIEKKPPSSMGTIVNQLWLLPYGQEITHPSIIKDVFVSDKTADENIRCSFADTLHNFFAQKNSTSSVDEVIPVNDDRTRNRIRAWPYQSWNAHTARPCRGLWHFSRFLDYTIARFFQNVRRGYANQRQLKFNSIRRQIAGPLEVEAGKIDVQLRPLFGFDQLNLAIGGGPCFGGFHGFCENAGLLFHESSLFGNCNEHQRGNKDINCRDVYDDPFSPERPWQRFLSGAILCASGLGVAIVLGINGRVRRMWKCLLIIVGIVSLSIGITLLIFGHAWPSKQKCPQQSENKQPFEHGENVSYGS